jgi:hypothetical protein
LAQGTEKIQETLRLATGEEHAAGGFVFRYFERRRAGAPKMHFVNDPIRSDRGSLAFVSKPVLDTTADVFVTNNDVTLLTRDTVADILAEVELELTRSKDSISSSQMSSCTPK